MTNFTFSPSFSVSELLLRWTYLLGVAWAIHWLLRNRHARWRLILWRSILCFGLILPLFHFVRIPVVQIPIAGLAATDPVISVVTPTVKPAESARHAPSFSTAKQTAKPTIAEGTVLTPVEIKAPASPRPWNHYLAAIWMAGFALGALRLILLQLQLSRLRQAAAQANPELGALAQTIQVRLGISRHVDVLVSETISSPFACGLREPAIILPGGLARSLSANDLSVLLAHEFAHIRQHDLIWSVGWRWMMTVLWFHPLVWAIPSAHNLACEEEADRIAAAQVKNRETYTQLLAQLVLRIVSLPAVETELTMNGSSQIAQRLRHLKLRGIGAWSTFHSLAAFGLIAAMVLLTTHLEFSEAKAEVRAVEYKDASIMVLNEHGKPLPNSRVSLEGIRVKGRSGYFPNRAVQTDESIQEYISDSLGKALIKYPINPIPSLNFKTERLMIRVEHAKYCTLLVTNLPLSGGKPIQLVKGIPLQVSGHVGDVTRRVAKLAPHISESPYPLKMKDWESDNHGVYSYAQLSPGRHMLQIMGRFPSGELGYSEVVAFNAEPGKAYNFDLEMKAGARLEGRLDANVPRPVKNGRVVVEVRPKEFPALLDPKAWSELRKKYPNFQYYTCFRPIAEDGTFTFESLPPGEIDLMAHGEGFVSKNGLKPGERLPDNPSADGRHFTLLVPQTFPVTMPVTTVEVLTEQTAALELIAKTKDGSPLCGVSAFVLPWAIRMQMTPFHTTIYNDDEPFLSLTLPPALIQFGSTEPNGRTTANNIPSSCDSLFVNHTGCEPVSSNGSVPYQIPLKLTPGKAEALEVTFQRKKGFR